MNPMTLEDLVIAFDYYDGEAEGVARCDGAFSYFVRRACDECDDIDVYEYVSVDVGGDLFDEIATKAEANMPRNGVFVYAGANESLNRQLDLVLPKLRLQVIRKGQTTHGQSYLDSRRKRG